ncbi:recombinase family protein [Salinibacterium sp. SWN139]|uniref:recombinase family protein n=1 Tax=Salinibacterium sp. SWN139 TaxID=2792055 RepID=UPI0018CDB4D8|nr:recombinase family protein [Salinibacterium sp. SWN139]MBH0053775.1 recombinase family protein [Salinibacterium sp. SWN139]
MKVIGYLRVSTADQEYGIGAQRAAISLEATRRGWDVIWLEDSGRSGKSLDRPAVREALRILKRGDAIALVVSKLDRLTRSVHDFSGILTTASNEGWGLIMLDLGVDTTNPAGKLVANVVAAVAEWERDMIALRTREGLAAAKAKGVRLGAPSRQDPVTVARIQTLRNEGRTYRAIADVLNDCRVPLPAGGSKWHPASVRNIANARR